ncbi:hypothetical protein RWE15_04785 [Virgibacillus halophilus]|uniref:Uncharacterized protein n=1 Tax=Tigheibacillus halophilus TaxID=361280 RepID=A0ABU5C3L6_9BACI|nr:hypothetical protein [Virgibacillus halophilus]
MKQEIKPWLNSLHDVLQADKHAVESAIALEDKDTSAAWEGLAIASDAMAKSKQYTVKKIELSGCYRGSRGEKTRTVC